MFCSNCGKTIPDQAVSCPSCGFRLNGTSFYGAAYTSVQMPILPNRYRDIAKARANAAPAPKAQYVKADSVPSGENVDGMTTYVQLYDAAYEDSSQTRDELKTVTQQALQEEKEAAEAAEREAAAERSEAADPAEHPVTEAPAAPAEPPKPRQIDRSQLSEAALASLEAMEKTLVLDIPNEIDISTEEVVSEGQSGISQEVDDMIAQLEEIGSRRQKRNRRAAAYGRYDNAADQAEPREDIPVAEEISEQPEAADVEPAESDPSDDQAFEEFAEPEEPVKRKKRPRRKPKPRQQDPDDDQFEAFRTEEDDLEDGDFAEDTSYGRNEDDEEDDEEDGAPRDPRRILIVVIIVVLAIAVLAGGFVLVRRLTGASNSKVTISGVSQQLRDDGIALIRSHASTEYAQQITQSYTEGGDLTELSRKLSSSAAEVNALMPETPDQNDSLFVSALNKIETDIDNCITSDAVSGDDPAASASNWAVVNNAIAALEQATSVADLTAIINGDIVTAADINATPSPEPSVNHATLSKGDSSDDVLKLQNRLYELGYLLDDRDGNFGGKTQTAIKMFQQAVGLEVTGVADPATQAAIYADDAPRTEYAQSATKTVETAPAASTDTDTAQSEPDTAADTDTQPAEAADTEPAAETDTGSAEAADPFAAALSDATAGTGATTDTATAADTSEAADTAAEQETQSAEPETPSAAAGTALYKEGDSSADVQKLQDRLAALGYLLDKADGSYGSKTTIAVKMFQKAAGLTVTGEVDEATLTALNSDSAPKTEFAQ